MVYFLYCLLHVLGLFNSIKYIFPIRGQTYLPNDQDFSLIGNKKKKCTAETPEDWNIIMEEARRHPSPYNVEKITYDMFFNIKEAVSQFFSRQSKPPMKLKEVRMIKIKKDVPFVLVRYQFTGPWHRIMIRNKRKLPEDLELSRMYQSSLPLNPHKVNDLRKLMPYLSNLASHNFYKNLLSTSAPTNLADDVDNEDNSSGTED